VQLRKHRADGYLLAEWLAGMFLYVIISSGLYVGVDAYQRVLAIAQTENAAREFANDILRVRGRALAGSDQGYIELSSNRKAYWVCRRQNLVEKKRDFASGGSNSRVWFSHIPAYSIKFSINGSPSISGKFIIQHERIASVQTKIEIQPVTGRVRTERIY